VGVTACFVCIHALMTVVLVVSSECLRSSCACVGIEIFVLFKCLVSSMHKLLNICMGAETLAVLFKCLESSMHKFLYAWGLRHLLFCPSF
jgi:hypothetical protein